MDDLKDTKNMVAEIEELLQKSVEHAKELPSFMRRLLGVTNQIKDLEEEKQRLQNDQNEAGDEQAQNTIDFSKALNETNDVITAQIAGIKGVASAFLSAAKAAKALLITLLSNPITALLAAAAVFVGDLVRNFTKVRDEIGGSVIQAGKLAFEIQKAQRSSVLLQFSGQLVRDTAKAITQEFGTINAATGQSIKNIAEFAKLNSIAATDAVKLARLFDILSISSDAARDNLKDAATNAGILVNQAFEDVARNADFFAKFTDEGAKNISRATVFAKQLGLSLDATTKISEKLLNVEEAIAGQFQLSAVLGQRVNFEEATRLNFLGKTGKAQEAVVAEIRRAVEAQGGFTKLLPLQRQAIADAFNLTTAEVAKLVSAGANVAVGAPVGTTTPVVPQALIQNDDIKALKQGIDDLRTSNAQVFEQGFTSLARKMDNLVT